MAASFDAGPSYDEDGNLKSKLEKRPVERLIKLGEKVDRSINYLVVNAIIKYLR